MEESVWWTRLHGYRIPLWEMICSQWHELGLRFCQRFICFYFTRKCSNSSVLLLSPSRNYAYSNSRQPNSQPNSSVRTDSCIVWCILLPKYLGLVMGPSFSVAEQGEKNGLLCTLHTNGTLAQVWGTVPKTEMSQGFNMEIINWLWKSCELLQGYAVLSRCRISQRRQSTWHDQHKNQRLHTWWLFQNISSRLDAGMGIVVCWNLVHDHICISVYSIPPGFWIWIPGFEGKSRQVCLQPLFL